VLVPVVRVTMPVPVADGLELCEEEASEDTDDEDETVADELTVPVRMIWELPPLVVEAPPVIWDSEADVVVVAATKVVDDAARPKPARKLGE